jgi:hypothetical protein
LAPEGGVDHRRVAGAGIARIERRAAVDQGAHGPASGLARGQVERGFPLILGLGADRRAGVDQAPDGPVVALVGGEVQGGHAVAGARCRGIGAAAKQEVDDVQAAEGGGGHQRGQALRPMGLDRGAPGKREIGKLPVVVARRLEQGGLRRARAVFPALPVVRRRRAGQEQEGKQNSRRNGGVPAACHGASLRLGRGATQRPWPRKARSARRRT